MMYAVFFAGLITSALAGWLTHSSRRLAGAAAGVLVFLSLIIALLFGAMAATKVWVSVEANPSRGEAHIGV